MRMKLALTAVLLLTSANALSAKTLKYSFTGRCDGITLVQNGDTYGGTHTGSCTKNDQAGGFSAKIPASYGTKYLVISTSDAKNAPGIVQTYLLNQSTLQWYLYETSNNAFTLTDQGTMTKGAPAERSDLPPTGRPQN